MIGLKHIWDARTQILANLPAPLIAAFAGAAAAGEVIGTPGLYAGSLLATFIAAKIEDQIKGRHLAKENYFNSDNPIYRHQENGRIIARVSSAVLAPVLLNITRAFV